MGDRWGIGPDDLCGRQETLGHRLDLRRLQWIGCVVDSPFGQPPPPNRVKDIAFGEEVFQSPVSGRFDVARWSSHNMAAGSIGFRKLSVARIGDPSLVVCRQAHPGIIIGKMKPASRNRDSNRVGSFQTEKPDSRIRVFIKNVCPNVGFVKV